MATLERAIEIAIAAHKGQIDKGSDPYVLHPLRIMMALDTRAEKIVGVLHDVVEDCADKGFDWRFIESQGFSDEVIRGLRSVTIAPEEEASLKAATEADKIGIYMEFIKRAGGDAIGRKVKMADLRDNMDVNRIDQLTEKHLHRLNRYKIALNYLRAITDTNEP